MQPSLFARFGFTIILQRNDLIQDGSLQLSYYLLFESFLGSFIPHSRPTTFIQETYATSLAEAGKEWQTMVEPRRNRQKLTDVTEPSKTLGGIGRWCAEAGIGPRRLAEVGSGLQKGLVAAGRG